MLGNALIVHWGCIAEISNGIEPTAWATVPSTTSSKERYGRPHPLNTMVHTILGDHVPEIQLAAYGAKTRTIQPNTFILDHSYKPDILGHVLLIDDSWTSGGTAQSAAIMLKQQGARRVTIFCLGRIIDLNFCASMAGPKIADSYLRLRYRRGLCPWRRERHELG